MKKSDPQPTIPAISLGLNMAGGMTFFTLLGYWMGKKFNHEYWLLGGIFLGLFYCGYEVWKLIRNNG